MCSSSNDILHTKIKMFLDTGFLELFIGSICTCHFFWLLVPLFSWLCLKDLGLAQNTATNTKTPIPLGSLAHQIYRVMCSRGYANKDFSSVFQFLREEEGQWMEGEHTDSAVTIHKYTETHIRSAHTLCPLSQYAQEMLRPCSRAQTCYPVVIPFRPMSPHYVS